MDRISSKAKEENNNSTQVSESHDEASNNHSTKGNSIHDAKKAIDCQDSNVSDNNHQSHVGASRHVVDESDQSPPKEHAPALSSAKHSFRNTDGAGKYRQRNDFTPKNKRVDEIRKLSRRERLESSASITTPRDKAAYPQRRVVENPQDVEGASFDRSLRNRNIDFDSRTTLLHSKTLPPLRGNTPKDVSSRISREFTQLHRDQDEKFARTNGRVKEEMTVNIACGDNARANEGLKRFVTRLNSSYGDQLSKTHNTDRSTLSRWCDRYLHPSSWGDVESGDSKVQNISPNYSQPISENVGLEKTDSLRLPNVVRPKSQLVVKKTSASDYVNDKNRESNTCEELRDIADKIQNDRRIRHIDVNKRTCRSVNHTRECSKGSKSNSSKHLQVDSFTKDEDQKEKQQSDGWLHTFHDNTKGQVFSCNKTSTKRGCSRLNVSDLDTDDQPKPMKDNVTAAGRRRGSDPWFGKHFLNVGNTSRLFSHSSPKPESTSLQESAWERRTKREKLRDDAVGLVEHIGKPRLSRPMHNNNQMDSKKPIKADLEEGRYTDNKATRNHDYGGLDADTSSFVPDKATDQASCDIKTMASNRFVNRKKLLQNKHSELEIRHITGTVDDTTRDTHDKSPISAMGSINTDIENGNKYTDDVVDEKTNSHTRRQESPTVSGHHTSSSNASDTDKRCQYSRQNSIDYESAFDDSDLESLSDLMRTAEENFSSVYKLSDGIRRTNGYSREEDSNIMDDDDGEEKCKSVDSTNHAKTKSTDSDSSFGTHSPNLDDSRPLSLRQLSRTFGNFKYDDHHSCNEDKESKNAEIINAADIFSDVIDQTPSSKRLTCIDGVRSTFYRPSLSPVPEEQRVDN